MHVALSALWLPILVSSVFVFFAANILWMAPFWHRKDYGTWSNSATMVTSLKDVGPGMYLFPTVDWGKASAEEKAVVQSGPMGVVLLRNPGSTFSFPKAMISYFAYTIVISTLVAYIAAATLEPGTHYLRVFQVVGAAGMLAYSFGTFGDSIWYGKPWIVTIKTVIDGIVYGLLMAGTFGWLWPR